MSCQKNMEAYFSYKKIKNGSPERERKIGEPTVWLFQVLFFFCV